MKIHLWSFYAYAPRHNMLTLQERVPISTGNKFQWCVFYVDYMSTVMCQACEWNSQQLTECITHVLLFWLTARGYHLTPFFQCCLGGMNRPSSWMRKFLRVLDTYLILLDLTPQMFGLAWGQRWSLKLQNFLDGVLHRAVAIEGACYSLHNALESTLLNLSSTACKSYYSWGCLLTLAPRKSNKRFVETFCWKRFKKITFFFVQQAQRLGDLASNTVLVTLGWQFMR